MEDTPWPAVRLFSKAAATCLIFHAMLSPDSLKTDNRNGLRARTMTRILPRLLSLALVAVTTACGASSEVARGEAIFDTCAPCHGVDGAGDQTLEAPAIAGASEWYLRAQLTKFKTGQRGYHYSDEGGLRMRPMSRALETEEDVNAIVAYVTSLPAADPPAVGHGDADAGEDQYDAVCVACHGEDGAGMEALNAPSLLHLSDWYIASSVRKYRDRIRGSSPGDASGITMYPIVAQMTDEQIDDVTSYIMTMRPRPRRPATAGGPATPTDAGASVEIDPATLPEGATVAMAQEGASIFAGPGICYTCHAEGGVGGPLAPNLTDDVWLNIDGAYASIIDVINAGVAQPLEHPGAMLPRAGMPLTDDQVAAVAAYVYTLSR